MEGTERLEKRFRIIAILGFEEICQCNTQIKDRAGQSDCGGGVSQNGSGYGIGQTYEEDNTGHHCVRELDFRQRDKKE